MEAKPARNILELDSKFQTVYAQGASLTQTHRSQSFHLTNTLEKKRSNIMSKINTMFDKNNHKKRNEDIILNMRQKAMLRLEKYQEQQHTS